MISKKRRFRRNIDYIGDMGKKLFLKVNSKNLLFLKIFITLFQSDRKITN